MFTSVGTLRYSPKLLGDRVSENWWLVIDCDPEIGVYFRQLYYLFSYKCRKIQRPAWKEHISVIRNEPPPNVSLWEKYADQKIEFILSETPESDGEYFWLPAKCTLASDIRIELGLSEQPYFPFHLSFGRTL